jgi:hypothetical protein
MSGAHHPAAGNAAIAPRLAIGERWPGVPPNYPNPQKLVSADCIKPSA